MRQLIRKVDSNQPEIIKALRNLGYSVQPIHTIGKGTPDLLAGKYGHNFIFECKDGSLPPSKRRLTPDEETWYRNWNGSVHIIENVEDVIEFDRKRSQRHSQSQGAAATK
jgi:hypothetical protein